MSPENANDKIDLPKDKAADTQKLQPAANKESIAIIKKAGAGDKVPDSIGKAEVVDGNQKVAAAPTDTTAAAKTNSKNINSELDELLASDSTAITQKYKNEQAAIATADARATTAKDSTPAAATDSTATSAKDSTPTTAAATDSTATAAKDSTPGAAAADPKATIAKDSTPATAATTDSTVAASKDSTPATAATTDSTATANKDTAPVLTEHQKAIAEFIAVGGTAKLGPDGSTTLPDGSTQFIDKNNHVIGVIYPQDADVLRYKWDGDQLVGVQTKNNDMTRVSHKDGAIDQWQTKDGQSYGMNVQVSDHGTMTYQYDDGRKTIANSSGSYIEFQKDNSSVEHTKDRVEIYRRSDLKIFAVQYPSADPKEKQTGRTIAFDDKTGNPCSYTAGNGSHWLSNDGLSWRQVNLDGTPNLHKNKEGKQEQARFYGPISIEADGSFKHLSLSPVNKDGQPEPAHLTAYDKFGKPVSDTANQDNFHAEVAKYCQDYIQDYAQKNNGNPVPSAAVEKTLADENASSNQKVAALFLQHMFPAKSNYTAGVEPSITLMAANTWLATAKNQDSAAVVIASAISGRPYAPQNAIDNQPVVANTDNAAQTANTDNAAQPANADQATVAQAKELTPQQVEAPQKTISEPLADSSTAEVEQERAVGLAKEASAFFDHITGHTGSPVSRQDLVQIANGPDTGHTGIANYLLQLMPPDAQALDKGFIADLLQHPRLLSKDQIAQARAEDDKRYNK